MTRLPPVRVARAANGVRSALQGMARRMVPPEVGVLELSTAFMTTQAVYAVARLGVADALAAGPRSAEEIAAEIGTNADATHRLLRASAVHGIVRQDGDRFDLTALGRTLVSDSPDSMRSVALMIGDPRYQAVWGQLPDAVRTGGPRTEAVHGVSMWELLDRDPDYAVSFNDAMTRLTALDWPTVEAVYDFTRFGTIVDIGGGHGQLLALALRAAPAADGVLFEQPSLIGPAEQCLRDAGVLDRCRLVGGSFFDTAPEDGDLYVLRRVVHDFDSDQAVALLSVLRRHMPADATLLLMESVIPAGNEPHFAKMLDLDMLLFVGGRERTEEEFASLLDRSGFRLTRLVPTISTISLIEARPRA